jgi:Zn-dependent M32 family carboxypeptidase
LDALRKAETWLRRLSDDAIDQDPKFERFTKLIKAHDENARAHKWLSAHDEIEAAFSVFVELTNQIMTSAKERLDVRDKKEKPVHELLESYKNHLKQISRAAQTVAENADGMLDSIERASKR